MIKQPEKRMPTISLGAQVGGSAAHEATKEHVLELRRLLAELCVGPYSPEVDEFAPILRVDGSVAHWDFEGCERLRRSRKERYITVDIGVPISRWQRVSAWRIRTYLADSVSKALELFISRLKKDKTAIDQERLRDDFAKVRSAYLRQ